MTEKRFTYSDVWGWNIDSFLNVMNGLDRKNNELKERIKELGERNQRQYERLKELTDLMYEKQWEKLENIVEEWEKQEELLQAEWGTYCENK